MEFLQTLDTQIIVGVAVALVAIGAGAFYFYSSKKSKGLVSYFVSVMCNLDLVYVRDQKADSLVFIAFVAVSFMVV